MILRWRYRHGGPRAVADWTAEMVRQTPVSAAARQRLRDQQKCAAKAVAAFSTASNRFEVVVARRAQVLARQDELVAAARTHIEKAVVTAVEVLGADVAATVLGLRLTEVRRMVREARETSKAAR